MALMLLACLHRPPAAVLPVEQVAGFKIEVLGTTIAGTGVFAEEGEGLVFQALTPAGTALFTVRDEGGQEPEVTAPSEEMEEMLARIPWHRDLSLLFRWDCPQGRCTVETGRVVQTSDTRRYRGEGGPATVTLTEERLELWDPRRRYRLTVLR